MTIKQSSLLFIAAKTAYKEGKLTPQKYLGIIKDIEENLIELDKEFLESEAEALVLKYNDS